MSKYFLVFFFLTFVANHLFSQEFTLNGELIDGNSQPIPYANILLIKVSDSTVYKGTSSTEKGEFIFENVLMGKYLLHISFVGFKDYQLDITITKDQDLDKIVLEESAEVLNEIQIIAKKPTLRKESDRLVFNIEKTSLTEGSIWDVLKGTPGVLIINDEISVKNSGNIIYLINDKRVYLSSQEIQQLLSGTNANSVQSVEVITNPPAKYDASGGAVINIKMNKNLVTGYNGNIYGNYTNGIYPRYNFGTGHFFKGKKLNIYLGYSYDYQKINRTTEEDILFIENDINTGRWQSEIDRNTKSKSHNATMNLDYDFNENNTLSFSANSTIMPTWERDNHSFTQAIDSTFSAHNASVRDSKNIAFNLGFQNTSKKGNTFSTNFNYTFNQNSATQDVSTVYRDSNDDFLRNNTFDTSADQKIDIFTGQLDYSIPFKDESTLEFGSKASWISSDNNFLQNVEPNSQIEVDNSGIFNYLEKIYAAYLNYNKSWESWDLSLGLRAEYTEVEGDLVNVETNNFDYLKLFPVFNLTRNFNENHSLGISYNRRIERPSYSDLNPFQIYLNDNTFFVGNPELQPTISQMGTLSYTLNQAFTFEFYYRVEENPISELTFSNNEDKVIRYQSANLKEARDFGFDILVYTPIADFWSTYILNSIFYYKSQFFAEESGNIIQENDRWSMYSNVINYFSLDKDRTMNAELSVLYISPVIEGSAEVSHRLQVDFSFKKSFNKGKWVLSLSCNDIFNTTDYTVKNNYLNQKNKYYTKFDNQWVRVGLRYNFGNTKLETNQNVSSQAEQERIKTRD